MVLNTGGLTLTEWNGQCSHAGVIAFVLDATTSAALPGRFSPREKISKIG